LCVSAFERLLTLILSSIVEEKQTIPIQRFNDSTIQRFNGSTVQRFNGLTVRLRALP